MEKVNLLNLKGEKIEDYKLKPEIFDITPNEKVLYDAIILSQASLRQGTYKVKNRSEVNGGGRKPYRQKGTGHARQGSIRAPQYRGGGVALGPIPRDYSKKMNRKVRTLALKSALATKANANEIIVLDKISFATPKTKEMVSLLKTLNFSDKKVLFVINDFEENVLLASRNLGNIAIIASNEINVLDLTIADVVIFTRDAIKSVEEVLK